jgi:tRNA-dihydrouridine synthase
MAGHRHHRDVPARIAEVKASVRIPVIGNVDVTRPEDAVRIVRETNCDAVMIGRAASSNPWIFRQIADYLRTGTYETPSEHARYELMRLYYSMLRDQGATDPVDKMKPFATYFTHGVRNGSPLRAEIYFGRALCPELDSGHLAGLSLLGRGLRQIVQRGRDTASRMRHAG